MKAYETPSRFWQVTYWLCYTPCLYEGGARNHRAAAAGRVVAGGGRGAGGQGGELPRMYFTPLPRFSHTSEHTLTRPGYNLGVHTRLKQNVPRSN